MSISWIFRVLYLFLLWVPMFAQNQESDAYTRRVIALQVEEDMQNESVSGIIILDNGSKWIWNPCLCCCRKLDAWDIGDEIRILKTVNGQYKLYNGKHISYQPEVQIEASSMGGFPTIYAIEDYGQTLVLSDGSEWDLGWWSAQWVYFWKIGDPVIVTSDVPAHMLATHRIVNMNKEKTEFNDCSYVNATLLQGD